ncbi:uncharacterized protein LOC135687496 [Rhopilema esculentum]|uniref:uncharacterized protein LOC135687496 n=1 Tax=Rhopilema esculentum TaxID=499914 RepID=UPI0031D72DC6
MMNTEEVKNVDKARRNSEKEQKRARKTSRFRKLSISRGRANTNKDKRRNSEEVQLLHTAEEDETEVEVDRESTGSRKIGVPTIDEIELKEVPVYMICPKCGEKGVTRTTVERSKEAECVSLCLCLLQCYCCCWVPLVLKRMKQVIHTCPNCRRQISVYKRVNFLSRFTKSEEHDAET